MRYTLAAGSPARSNKRPAGTCRDVASCTPRHVSWLIVLSTTGWRIGRPRLHNPRARATLAVNWLWRVRVARGFERHAFTLLRFRNPGWQVEIGRAHV